MGFSRVCSSVPFVSFGVWGGFIPEDLTRFPNASLRATYSVATEPSSGFAGIAPPDEDPYRKPQRQSRVLYFHRKG